MTESFVDAQHALADIIGEIDARYAAGDLASAATLIEANLAEAWYGFPPDRLREILAAIVDAGCDTGGVARVLHTIISPVHMRRYAPTEVRPTVESPSVSLSTMLAIGETFELRLRGRAEAALRIFDDLEQRGHEINPFFDMTSGWDVLISVQTGVTAMLAGDFTRAQRQFAEAQLHVPAPSLIFLTRDAYVKAALVQALVGDTDEARASLEHAAAIPRTNSWAEALIDANAAWVNAVLDPDADRAIHSLLDVPPSDVGEMWPFLALVLQRVYFRAGRWRELGERIAILEKIPFPKVDGEGFTGSVLPVVRALMQLRAGDISGAAWHLEHTDDEQLIVRILRAQLELDAGRSARAIALAHTLGQEALGLRQIEMWRYAILATAHLELDQPESAQESLRAALELSGEIREEDMRFFTDAVIEFASAHIDGWFLGNIEDTGPRPGHGVSGAVRLTDREREILRYLAKDLPRAEIADELFISLNTLKSHLRKVYGKLGVSSRDAAILRAEREGWI